MLKDVRMIEIEIHSYCNRVCEWCPNNKIYRHDFNDLPENLYLKILNELKNNYFNGVISFSRYNEPLYDSLLINKRTKQAKEILPNIKLVTNTNGDYLREQNIKDLYIDELTIMDYDCKGLEKCKEKLINANIKIDALDYPYIYGHYNNMKILYYINWPNFAEIEDRGGFLTYHKTFSTNNDMNWKNNKEKRKRPCYEPKYFIAIDYNGNVMPCCHLRSDNEDHKKMILGNIKNESLVEIYHSPKAKYIRNTMSLKNNNKYFNCCKYCQKDPGRYTRNKSGINYKE
ncbi:MAG: SPASM domain-containing protein [archaeon]